MDGWIQECGEKRRDRRKDDDDSTSFFSPHLFFEASRWQKRARARAFGTNARIILFSGKTAGGLGGRTPFGKRRKRKTRTHSIRNLWWHPFRRLRSWRLRRTTSDDQPWLKRRRTLLVYKEYTAFRTKTCGKVTIGKGNTQKKVFFFKKIHV